MKEQAYERVRFATGVTVVGTESGAEVHYPGWAGPIEIPAGYRMSVRVETEVFPERIEPVDQTESEESCGVYRITESEES